MQFSVDKAHRQQTSRYAEAGCDTYGVRLELLNQDAVKERHDGLDGLERSLGSLEKQYFSI